MEGDYEHVSSGRMAQSCNQMCDCDSCQIMFVNATASDKLKVLSLRFAVWSRVTVAHRTWVRIIIVARLPQK